jgi:hypothetical protein
MTSLCTLHTRYPILPPNFTQPTRDQFPLRLFPIVIRLKGQATPGTDFHPDGGCVVLALVESQVLGISNLRVVGYTLGFIVVADGFERGPCLGNPDVLPISPWLKKILPP